MGVGGDAWDAAVFALGEKDTGVCLIPKVASRGGMEGRSSPVTAEEAVLGYYLGR